MKTKSIGLMAGIGMLALAAAAIAGKGQPHPHVIARAGEAGDIPSEEVYVCPMHPEIRQNEAGTCSLCGMRLEPVETADESEEETV